KKKKPKAIIIRYLNDYKSLSRSTLRTCTDLSTVLLAKILKMKIYWMCHNVDKESKEHHPLLTKLRRKTIIKTASKIVVTDFLLKKYAEDFLKVKSDKLDYITFGETNFYEKVDEKDGMHQKIISFINKNKKENTIVGLSIGNPNNKVRHLFYTNELIKKGKEKGLDIKIIIGGPLRTFMKSTDIIEYKKLLSNSNVLLLEGKIQINEKYLSKFIDFYWRAYSDYSVPFSVYNATYLKKPLLSLELGLLQEMIIKYDIGVVLEKDMNNILDIISYLNDNKKEIFETFNRNHNWQLAAKRLEKLLINSSRENIRL